MNNQFVVVQLPELRKIIHDEVSVAVQQISFLQKVDPLPEFLTIQEAAAFLNLAVPSLYSMVSRGDLPYIKKTKKLYFSRESLVEYLVSGKQKTKQEIISKTLKITKP